MPFNVLTKRRYTRENALDRAMPPLTPTVTATGKIAGWQALWDLTGRPQPELSRKPGRYLDNGYTGSATANWQAAYGTLGSGITTTAINMTLTGSCLAVCRA